MHKIGKTMYFDTPVVITGHAGVVGKKEGEGPLAKDFDAIFEDTSMGQQSYELAESAMLHDAIIRALSSAKKSPSEVDYVLSGDLLDQCMGSAFALKDLNIASIGLFGACSTMALSMSVGSMLVENGADCIVTGTSSHFCSSERQFRFPLEYGGQRPPTAQWTVTGAGSAVVEKGAKNENAIKIKAVHIGTITDYGITDANNMGAAMAPAIAIIRPWAVVCNPSKLIMTNFRHSRTFFASTYASMPSAKKCTITPKLQHSNSRLCHNLLTDIRNILMGDTQVFYKNNRKKEVLGHSP
ncbi:MAG: hypothetical protein J1E81_09455 [Eubacterium sp.]|nr:hypothetical protein [Eubacterium sp.]